uniref:LIM domain protein n=1 Tax=Macrostomum lignano TaxID=282301 RepID=A0A1I8HD61_9PLAT
MQSSWHPDCFTCQLCGLALTDAFVKNLGRALCKDCNAKERVRGAARFLCNRCHDIIEADQVLRFKGDNYHPYHFNCTGCRAELTAEAREKDDQLYCIRCFDKLGVPVCARCRRPIEERVVHAINKAWHVEHFVDECVQACCKSWCSAHFQCSVCDRQMNQKTKFYEYDLKPVCKPCYEKFPTELRKRLAKIHKLAR